MRKRPIDFTNPVDAAFAIAGIDTPGADVLPKVRAAVQGYYAALDRREHAVSAQGKAFDAIEAALGMHWVRGATLTTAAPPAAEGMRLAEIREEPGQPTVHTTRPATARECMEKAAQLAELLRQTLQQANNAATCTQSLVLVSIIPEAAKLAMTVGALLQAMEVDDAR